MSFLRFEAVFYPGETDERLPSWDVVEWLNDDGRGNRSGRTIASFYYDDPEAQAQKLAAEKQQEYEDFLCEMEDQRYQYQYDEFEEGC